MNSNIGFYEQDLVVLLDSVPSPANDASEPFIVANERRVLVAYRIRQTLNVSARSVMTMTRSVSLCFRRRSSISSDRPTTKTSTLTHWRHKACEDFPLMKL
jgi:hypothetical protein